MGQATYDANIDVLAAGAAGFTLVYDPDLMDVTGTLNYVAGSDGQGFGSNQNNGWYGSYPNVSQGSYNGELDITLRNTDGGAYSNSGNYGESDISSSFYLSYLLGANLEVEYGDFLSIPSGLYNGNVNTFSGMGQLGTNPDTGRATGIIDDSPSDMPDVEEQIRRLRIDLRKKNISKEMYIANVNAIKRKLLRPGAGFQSNVGMGGSPYNISISFDLIFSQVSSSNAISITGIPIHIINKRSLMNGME